MRKNNNSSKIKQNKTPKPDFSEQNIFSGQLLHMLVLEVASTVQLATKYLHIWREPSCCKNTTKG